MLIFIYFFIDKKMKQDETDKILIICHYLPLSAIYLPSVIMVFFINILLIKNIYETLKKKDIFLIK